MTNLETNTALQSTVKIQHIAWKITWLREEKDRIQREYKDKIYRIDNEIEMLQKAISNSNCTSTAR